MRFKVFAAVAGLWIAASPASANVLDVATAYGGQPYTATFQTVGDTTYFSESEVVFNNAFGPFIQGPAVFTASGSFSTAFTSFSRNPPFLFQKMAGDVDLKSINIDLTDQSSGLTIFHVDSQTGLADFLAQGFAAPYTNIFSVRFDVAGLNSAYFPGAAGTLALSLLVDQFYTPAGSPFIPTAGKFDTLTFSSRVIEPPVWLAMIFGFAGAGLALRRRRRASAQTGLPANSY